MKKATVTVNGKITHWLEDSEEKVNEWLAANSFPSGSVRLQDTTVEHKQKLDNEAAESYLRETDWYAIRKAETGIEIPEEIKQARAASRASIIRN